MTNKCSACYAEINTPVTGEPYLDFKKITLCFNCYLDITPEIYNLSGAGDGGLLHLIFSDCLKSNRNRKKRRMIPRYKETLEALLNKFNFECAYCQAKEKLTIDHIHPVSLGGGDEVSNLQILCRSCNSKKGAKIC